jgi:transcriptional repressor NrdR
MENRPFNGDAIVICPYCGEDNDRVIDSRASHGGVTVRRRRQCEGCAKRYTTYERVEKTARLMVIKRDGSRVPFEMQSILGGIQAACGKRPIPEADKHALAQAVEDAVHREFSQEVPSDEIGQRVATRLRELDEIAYIRYASEYHAFHSLDEFAEELSELKSRPRNLPNQTDLFPSGKHLPQDGHSKGDAS